MRAGSMESVHSFTDQQRPHPRGDKWRMVHLPQYLHNTEWPANCANAPDCDGYMTRVLEGVPAALYEPV